MLIKKEVTINADVKKVWKTFSELEKWPVWSSCILKTRWLTREKWKKNSMFSQTIKGFGLIKQLKSKVKLISAEPFRKVTWVGARKLINGTHTFEFVRIGSRTKVLNYEAFKGPLAPILFPLVRKNFEICFGQFLDGLKKESERQLS